MTDDVLVIVRFFAKFKTFPSDIGMAKKQYETTRCIDTDRAVRLTEILQYFSGVERHIHYYRVRSLQLNVKTTEKYQASHICCLEKSFLRNFF